MRILLYLVSFPRVGTKRIKAQHAIKCAYETYEKPKN